MLHAVAPGECFLSLARQYGFADARTLYEHPENAELRRTRPNPALLAPGDQVFIPEKRAKQAVCATEATHRFTVQRPVAFVRLVLRDRRESPIPDSDYVLRVGSVELRGRTSEGLVEQKVDAAAQSAELFVPDRGLRLRLRIGHLDPIDTVSGLKARLRNLRYHVGATDDLDDATTRQALRAFARKEGLGEDADLDAVRSALTQKHGS
jgi:hypothetical protein